MNPVEIEEAVEALSQAPFDAANFAYDFLEAFGNKETTIKRLKTGSSNSSDVVNGVLQRNNIHIAVADNGKVEETFQALRNSPKTKAGKVKFILATDGTFFNAEDMASSAVAAGDFVKFADHFGFFLSLAGISTVNEIKNNPIDIKATGRLNRLYVELLKENPDWSGSERRHDLNQFMARLIFCFFAQGTGIFKDNLFISTVEQMADKLKENTDELLVNIFRMMDIKIADRKAANLPRYADHFPYVNGSLFSGAVHVPRFSRIARTYLMRAGELDWQKINPDIFGSMIQGVADADERANLGMHYTSVPNILKVLNPLFLDELNAKLNAAGDNKRKLLNLRRRISRIRVFDPACGSGNFLVISYIKLRELEYEICNRLKSSEEERQSWIKLNNFYGLEIKDFAVEVARLSLLIAEYQCDVRFISQKMAHELMLPLRETGNIKCANALREDWLQFCPPTKPYDQERDDLFDTTDTVELDEENGETYICGNPPYIGDKMQLLEHKSDVEFVLGKRIVRWKSLDYVCAFFAKGVDLVKYGNTTLAFVTTKSIMQGQQVSIFWPEIFISCQIVFAHRPFKWENLASHNAGVTCVIIGIEATEKISQKIIYDDDAKILVTNISPYLTDGPTVFIEKASSSICHLPTMRLGNVLKDDGHLQITDVEYNLILQQGDANKVRNIVGSTEFIRGVNRKCLYILDAKIDLSSFSDVIRKKLEQTIDYRKSSRAPALQDLAKTPNLYYFHLPAGKIHTIVVPRVTSENRDYLPVGFLPKDILISDRNYGLLDAPIWVISLIASRLHWVWIGTVCVRMRTDFSYSNTLGWNTFPVPFLTEQNKADLTKAAEDILLAREQHFPATIADLYKPDTMPENLRLVHQRNDEILERIYIGRRFKNDTERLEKLFELYTKMTKKKDAV